MDAIGLKPLLFLFEMLELVEERLVEQNGAFGRFRRRAIEHIRVGCTLYGQDPRGWHRSERLQRSATLSKVRSVFGLDRLEIGQRSLSNRVVFIVRAENPRLQFLQVAFQLLEKQHLLFEIVVVVPKVDLFGHDLSPLMHDQRTLMRRQNRTERCGSRRFGRDSVVLEEQMGIIYSSRMRIVVRR